MKDRGRDDGIKIAPPSEPDRRFSRIRLSRRVGSDGETEVSSIGNSAIPKSARPGRISENINVFDFSLTKDELEAIDALDTGKHGGPDPEQVTPQMFPLKIED
jgi:hypothetical protein